MCVCVCVCVCVCNTISRDTISDYSRGTNKMVSLLIVLYKFCCTQINYIYIYIYIYMWGGMCVCLCACVCLCISSYKFVSVYFQPSTLVF